MWALGSVLLAIICWVTKLFSKNICQILLVAVFTFSPLPRYICTYFDLYDAFIASQVGIKNLPANAGDARDMALIPGLGRSPRVGNRSPHQCSYLENSMDRGAWWATAHGVAESQILLSRSMNTFTENFLRNLFTTIWTHKVNEKKLHEENCFWEEYCILIEFRTASSAQGYFK